MTVVEQVQRLGSTDRAAAAVGVDPSAFRAWAADRGLKPARYVRLGRSTIAVWDIDAVFAAEQLGPLRSTSDKKRGRRG